MATVMKRIKKIERRSMPPGVETTTVFAAEAQHCAAGKTLVSPISEAETDI